MTTKMDVSEDVRELLKTHDFLDLVETGDDATGKRVRVRCALTQHEIVPRKEAIETYLNSKPFRKAKEWYCYDYSQYEPYIVSHRRKPKSLYCNVTDTVLNRIPSEVEKHVNGKKFKRMKEHVKFEIKKTQDEQDEEEFDANEFEFENRQVLNSDDEEEEEEGVAGAEEDDEELDLELDEEEEAEEDDGDDDMKDLYPDDDVSDDEQVRFIHTAVEKEDGEKKEKKPKKEKKEKKTESKKRKLEDKATAETEEPVEKKSKPTKAPKEPKAAKTEAEAPVVKAKGERPPNKKELRHARKLAAKQQKLQQQAAAEATTN